MSIAKNHFAKVIIKDVFVVFSEECFYCTHVELRYLNYENKLIIKSINY